MRLTDEARQHIRDAFDAVERLPHLTDERSAKLLEDTLSALASASWWLDDWEARLADVLSWVPGVSTAYRGV